MEDGNIPLSNSEAERSIRDFAVLRHSTASGFASIKGAESVAVFSSFHETCKKFGVPPQHRWNLGMKSKLQDCYSSSIT